jgi:TPR repeat protein
MRFVGVCVLLGAFLWYGIPASPAEADFNAGVAAYKKGDFAAAVAQFSADGRPASQYFLATMYYEGKGVPLDRKAAADWFRKAAEQGDTHAQYRLGIMYLKGDGVPQDKREASSWLRKAADSKDATTKAGFLLGAMNEHGEGVPRNSREAVQWYRKAAEQGDARSQYALGVMYFNGLGVDRDKKEAVRWFRAAAAQGNTQARQALDLSVHNDNFLPEAIDGTLKVVQDSTAGGTLKGSDPVEGSKVVFRILKNGEKGVAILTDAAKGSYSYKPNAGVIGTDRFTFVARDGSDDSNTATVTVTITDKDGFSPFDTSDHITRKNPDEDVTMSSNDGNLMINRDPFTNVITPFLFVPEPGPGNRPGIDIF